MEQRERQQADCSGQKADNRGQKTEVGGRKSEIRGQNVDWRLRIWDVRYGISRGSLTACSNCGGDDWFQFYIMPVGG